MAHNITNLDRVLTFYGAAKNPTGVGGAFHIPLPYAHTDYTYAVMIDIRASNIRIRTAQNQTEYTESYITVEYTKT